MRILYLDLDTLRPDHLGCYGYHRNTSPNLDRIAAQGTRFTNYYCSDAPCLPSRTALMTGRFGIHNGVVGHGGTAADLRLEGESRGFRSQFAVQTVPFLLRSAGYRTVSISPFAERHSSMSFLSGFNEMYNTGQGGMESAEHVSPVVMDWLERNAAEDDWFLQVNYWDPHTPYRAPESFGNPFADEPLPEWYTEDLLRRHQQLVGPHKPWEIAMFDNSTNPKYPRHPGELRDMEGLRQMIDGYDCGIRYMDEHIGRILDHLEREGVLEDTAIIVSADHGENMGELGIYGEHGTADHATCRIPMIIKWPGKEQPAEDGELRYNLDLGPTLAALLGQQPFPGWDGSSYAGVLDGQSVPGRDFLVLSQCAHVCQRSVRFGDWLYIRTYHDGYHLFPKEQLFNLAEDPYEQTNRAESERELCCQAAAMLLDWHDEMMRSMPAGYTTDPLWTVMSEGGPSHARGQLAAYAEYLEETGRSSAVPILKQRHPQEFE